MNARRLALASLAVMIGLGIAPTTARAQSAPAASVDRFDAEIQSLWDKLRPSLEQKIRDEAIAHVASLSKGGSVQVSIQKLNHIDFSIANAPGFERIGFDRVVARVPLKGTWSVEVRAIVRVKIKVFGKHHWTLDVPTILHVENVALEGTVDIDSITDPTRPTIKRIAKPVVRFHVRVSSPVFVDNLILSALSPLGDFIAHRLLDNAMKKLGPKLAKYSGLPGPIPGDSAQPYQDSGAPTPFETIAVNKDREIRKMHMPHGALHYAYMDNALTDSWEHAYGPGGPGNVGNINAYDGVGDSAIWSGHWLAAQSFRWAATHDPEALDNVKAVLVGIGNMLDCNGGTGLLARSAAPVGSLVGQQIATGPPVRYSTIGGVPFISRQGSDGISRDQYSGVFFGLAVAHDLMQDPAVVAECSRRLQQMLDYIVAHQWYVDEDRPSIAANPAGFPTFWLGEDEQRFAWLLSGERAAPGKYAAELARLSPLAATSWLSAWLGSFDIDHYYKFNLGFIASYNYFRLETDPARFADMMRTYRIGTRVVAHHRNPHFDDIALTIEPARRAALAPSIRESMRRFLRRCHREVAPAVINTSGITWTTFTLRGFTIPGVTSGSSSGTHTVKMPTETLDPEIRAPHGAWFLWQKDPFDLATPNQGDAKTECSGVDLVLPIWMGKHHAVFP